MRKARLTWPGTPTIRKRRAIINRLARRRLCPATVMFEPEDTGKIDPQRLEEVNRRAPRGAMAIAGTATAIVFALWAAFYVAIFLPRGILR
jgi:hypothetical protein